MSEKEFKIHVFSKKDALYRFALSIMKNEEDAKDITQEVLLTLWKKRDKLSDIKNIKSFSLKAIKNRCLDQLKFSSKFSDELLVDLPSNLNLGEEIELKEKVECIEKIILKLPEKQQMVIHLRDVEGYAFEEIENILEMESSAVRTNLSRARKTVREVYDKWIKNEVITIKK